MLRIGLGEGLQECAGTLDIAAGGLRLRSERTEWATKNCAKGRDQTKGAHPISVEVLSNWLSKPVR